MFNLVFHTNIPSIKIWDSLGFTKIGVVPQAGRLKVGTDEEGNTIEEYVDATQYYFDLTTLP